MVELIFPMGMQLTTYKDISARFAAFEDAKISHFRALQAEAGQLLRFYEDSLALPESTWCDTNGQNRRYVQLGYLNSSGKFEECSHLSLLANSDDLSVDFAIRLTLEKAPGLFPKAAFVVPMKLRRVEQSIHCKIVDINQEFEINPAAGVGRYQHVCAAISQTVVNSFDPKIFGSSVVHY